MLCRIFCSLLSLPGSSPCAPEVPVDSLARESQDAAGTDGTTRGVLGEAREQMGLAPAEGAVVLLARGTPPSELRHEKDPDAEFPWKYEAGAGVLEIVPGSGSVCTRRKFGDFRLHLEFAVNRRPGNWGNDGNSGVYIQRRYEVQILNSYGRPLTKQDCGALYQQRLPALNASRPVFAWQSYDIAFRAPRWDGKKKVENARITVLHNGELIHDDVEMPNKTGAGLKEAPEPEFIRLQDHGNAVRFRNFWIQPLKL